MATPLDREQTIFRRKIDVLAKTPFGLFGDKKDESLRTLERGGRVFESHRPIILFAIRASRAVRLPIVECAKHDEKQAQRGQKVAQSCVKVAQQQLGRRLHQAEALVCSKRGK